jgi:protein-S-isoprenylcysteine O-methyltransferase Ste14
MLEHDRAYRLAIVLGLVAGACIGGYHRVQAHRAGGWVSHREEGLPMALALRLVALVGLAGLVAWLIRPAWMAWTGFPAPAWLRWLGVPLGAAALAWMWWTMHTLGTNLTDTVVTRARHTLVTGGPYRWVRHPYYLVVPLLAAAVSLLSATWWLAAWGAAVFGLLAVRSRKEEAQLLVRFGDEYDRYRRRTGRFWPRIGSG